MKCGPVLVLLCGVLGSPTPVAAQQGSTEYPQRPIRLVLPFAPGGGSDLLGRTIGQRLPSGLGQQIIIDNRPGGAAMIGADLVAKSRPDGYTLLFSSGAPISINVSLYSKMPYDPVRDLAPITLVASYPNLLIVHPSLPVRSVKELIALAKSRPGQMSYASGGNGTTQHLAGEMLKTLAGVDIVHVPYKGAGPAVIDLIGGHVALFFNTTGAALPFVKSGKVRALGVTSAKRSSTLPDLPTIAETLPGFEAIAWAGVFAPAGTPREIVNRLNHETVKILQSPEMRKSLNAQGFDVVGNSREEFAAFIQTDTARWAKVIKAAGIRAD